MSFFLDKIDAAPLNSDDFSFDTNSWMSVLVDTLNEDFFEIEESINNFTAPLITTVELAALMMLATPPSDGRIWFCTNSVPPTYVGKISGALVKFTTTPFP